MRAENLEKVLERLATSEKVTIVIERQPDGKMRVTSGCPFRKSYPRVAMMQSTQDGHSNDGTRPLDCSMQWRILVQ